MLTSSLEAGELEHDIDAVNHALYCGEEALPWLMELLVRREAWDLGMSLNWLAVETRP